MCLGRVCDACASLEVAVAKLYLRMRIRPGCTDTVVLLAEVIARDTEALIQTPHGDIEIPIVIGDVEIADAQVVQRL